MVMSQYAKNEEFIIQALPNSLICLAMTWFVHFDETKISLWKDPANLTLYKFNIKIPPDRFDLQKESIKL